MIAEKQTMNDYNGDLYGKKEDYNHMKDYLKFYERNHNGRKKRRS